MARIKLLLAWIGAAFGRVPLRDDRFDRDNPNVTPGFVEFEAVPVQGGTLCQNGKWRTFDGGASGTTPFRVFFKDGVFRGSP